MVGGTRIHRQIHERALVEMKEREEFLLGEENTSPAARTLFVSLDRADAIIEGAPYAVSACGAFDFASCVATNSRSKPIRENQLYKAGNPAGIKSLFADFVPSVLLPGMVAPLRRGCPRLPVQHLRQFIFFSRVGRPSCTLLRILFC